MVETTQRMLTPEELEAIEKQLRGRAPKGEGVRARLKKRRPPNKMWVWGVVIVAVALVLAGLWWMWGWACLLCVGIIVGVMVLLSVMDPTPDSDLPRHERAKRKVKQLRGKEVKVTRIQATAVVEMEEHKSEGVTYFFQVNEGELLCLCGQKRDDLKLNTDFDLIEGTGDVVCFYRGEKLTPVRIFGGEEKWRMIEKEGKQKLPRDGIVVPGHVETIEEDLAAWRRAK